MSSHIRLYHGVKYVARGRAAPTTFQLPTTCGNCGRTWDDAQITSWTPVPSGRCPFEYISGHRMRGHES